MTSFKRTRPDPHQEELKRQSHKKFVKRLILKSYMVYGPYQRNGAPLKYNGTPLVSHA